MAEDDVENWKEYEAACDENDRLRARIAALEDELHVVRTVYEDALHVLDENQLHIADLEADRYLLEKENGELERENIGLMEQVEGFRDQVEGFRKALAQAQSANVALMEENRTLKEAAAIVDERIHQTIGEWKEHLNNAMKEVIRVCEARK